MQGFFICTFARFVHERIRTFTGIHHSCAYDLFVTDLFVMSSTWICLSEGQSSPPIEMTFRLFSLRTGNNDWKCQHATCLISLIIRAQEAEDWRNTLRFLSHTKQNMSKFKTWSLLFSKVPATIFPSYKWFTDSCYSREDFMLNAVTNPAYQHINRLKSHPTDKRQLLFSSRSVESHLTLRPLFSLCFILVNQSIEVMHIIQMHRTLIALVGLIAVAAAQS